MLSMLERALHCWYIKTLQHVHVTCVYKYNRDTMYMCIYPYACKYRVLARENIKVGGSYFAEVRWRA